MWNSGNMHTDPAPPGVEVAPTYVRNQLARWDNTTPFGRPVLPLVKKMTCGSRSSTSDASGTSVTPVGTSGENGRSTRAASSAPASTCDAPHNSSRGRAYSATEAVSSTEARAFSGANTAPIFASAANTGTASMEVSPHHNTRSPRPTRIPRSPFAIRFARWSISPNVKASSSSVTATAFGATRAALASISEMCSTPQYRAVETPFACRQALLLVCRCHEELQCAHRDVPRTGSAG